MFIEAPRLNSMTIREDFEKREEAFISPYGVKASRSRGRRRGEPGGRGKKRRRLTPAVHDLFYCGPGHEEKNRSTYRLTLEAIALI